MPVYMQGVCACVNARCVGLHVCVHVCMCLYTCAWLYYSRDFRRGWAAQHTIIILAHQMWQSQLGEIITAKIKDCQ